MVQNHVIKKLKMLVSNKLQYFSQFFAIGKFNAAIIDPLLKSIP